MKNKKLEASLQIAQTECGLCCAKTILKYYGYDISITELRQILEPGRDGLSTEQLKELFNQLGLESKTYKIKDLRAFNIISFPVIAFWKGYHYVCVESFEKNFVIIMDPSIGRVKIDLQEFFENFSGIIVTAFPSENFQKRKIKITKRYDIKSFIPEKISNIYIKIAIISSLIVAINVAIPILTQILIDFFQYNRYTFIYLCLVIILLAGFTTVVYYYKSVLSIKLMKSFSWHLLSTAFSRVLLLPSKYFTVRTPGEIVYRLNSLTRIQDLFGLSVVQLFLDCISVIAILVYVALISKILVIVEIIFILFILIVLLKFQPKIRAITDNELHQSSLAQSIQLDAVVSINNIKLGGYKESYLKDWEDKYKKSLESTTKRLHVQQSLINTGLATLHSFAPLVILSISLYIYSIGTISFGQAIAIQSISTLLFGYINSIFTTFSDFFMLTRYVDLAEDIYDYPLEKSGEIELKDFSSEIKLENVCFSYGNNNTFALQNITFEIKNGETIALVGKSGSGKSTLGKIISSLFAPTSGTIYLNQFSYADYTVDSLRKEIGYIPQEAYLHNRSLIENLSLGSRLSESEIIEECRKFKFLNFIDNLPMGYNTYISEMGGNLSGGQRQRVQIAKILLQKPKLLVMDEATSSLDNVSQQYVYNELNKLECTKIIIAHRLETVLNADRIIVMDSFKVSQVGTHEELIKEDEGIYSELFKADILR